MTGAHRRNKIKCAEDVERIEVLHCHTQNGWGLGRKFRALDIFDQWLEGRKRGVMQVPYTNVACVVNKWPGLQFRTLNADFVTSIETRLQWWRATTGGGMLILHNELT